MEHIDCFARVALRVALGLAVLGSGLARAAEVPSGTEVLRLKLVPGKFGPVTFRHAQHNSTFKRPDGSAVRCKDCHHKLAGDEPVSAKEAKEDMKCSGCHARYGDPPKKIGGKIAPVLAAMNAHGAMDYKSILFHEYCWACHKKTMRNGHRNARCKLCHEHGVSDETMRTRFDSAPQPGTRLRWLRCPTGLRWTGSTCVGEPRSIPHDLAAAECPEGYRLPTRAEFRGLLSGCASGTAPCGCASSGACAELLGADEGVYWTSEAAAAGGWTIRLRDGAAAEKGDKALVRCVQRSEEEP